MSEKIDFTGIDQIDINSLQEQEDASAAVEQPLSPEQVAEVNKEIELEEKFGDNTSEASFLGALRGLSFGLSDQALVKSKTYTQEQLREIKKRNEIASLVGDVAGVATSFIPTGGAGAIGRAAAIAGKGVGAVSKGAKVAEKVAEKAFISALSKEGKDSAVRRIVKKTAPKVIGSSVEGAAYGAGQLISEDALGNAELNGENLLASAGTGALLGAVAGSAFEIPKALAPLKNNVSGKIKAKTKQISDPIDASFDIYGINPSQRTKLKKSANKFTEELPEWTVKKAKLGYFTDSEKLKNNIQKIREEAGTKVGDTIKKIDDVAKVSPEIMPSAQSTYATIAKKIDDDIISKYADVPGFKTQVAPVRAIRDEFVELAKSNKPLTAGNIHALRMKVDELIKFDKAPGTYTLKEQALNDVRFALNDEINNIAKAASNLDGNNQYGNLIEDLLEANKDYSYASRLLPNIEKKVDKDAAKKSIFNLSDLMVGGISYEVLGGLGGIGLGAKKLLESDFRRRVAILSNIEKQNKVVKTKLTKNLNEFFKSSKPAAVSTTTKALTTANLALNDDGKKPKNKKEAFNNISKRLTTLQTDPEKLQDLISKRTMHIGKVAPNTTSAVTQTSIRSLEFLTSKLPKPTTDGSLASNFSKRDFQPSQLQMSKFERYVEAVENPMSAVEDLKSGTLTREAAEAVKNVYPKIFETMQNTVIDKIAKDPQEIPYQKRLQLGILLDISTDASLDPRNIAALQSNLQPKETENSSAPTAARADSINKADRVETKQNQIAQR